MAFSTPSLSDLIRTAENGISSAFYGVVSVLRKGVLKVLARVFAGLVHLLFMLLRLMWRNVFISTADVESLKNFGTDFGIPNKPDACAGGYAIIKASSASIEIEQGVVLVSDSGIEFEVVADTILTGGEDGSPVKVLALESGDDGNLPAGIVLSFRDGVPEGVDEIVSVGDEGLNGGVKIEVEVDGAVEYWGETVEEYRGRLLDRRRNQPCGGSDADYKSWAERFSQVSRCVVEECYPAAGAVRCVLCHFDDADSVTVSSDAVQEVSNYIKSDDRRPITADVSIVSCKNKVLNLAVKVYPNNENIHASVRTALRNALRSYSPGDTVRADALTVKLLESSVAEKIAVTSVLGQQAVVLDRADAEMPVVGDIAWSEYSV